jgi:aquaporin Z
MMKYVTEFIGTFFLVLTIGLTATAKVPVPMAPLAIGCSLMIMVYMGGHISGGHYNPAVSLAALIRGALSIVDFVPYLIVVQPGKNVTAMSAFWVEAIYTFALALVVLNVATSKKTQGNSFYGLAIGFTIVVAAFAGGAVSGGAFNPAVGCGPALYNLITGAGEMPKVMMGESPIGVIWLYIAGPFAGAIVAAFVFRAQEAAVTK